MYQGGDVQNEPYNEQNHESVTNNNTKTLKVGVIAPMVPFDNKKQKTKHNKPAVTKTMLVHAVDENIHRGDVKDETHRENGNYTKNMLMPAVNKNINRGTVKDETYQGDKNYTMNVLLSAMHYPTRHHRPGTNAKDLQKDEEIKMTAFAVEGEEGHN